MEQRQKEKESARSQDSAPSTEVEMPGGFSWRRLSSKPSSGVSQHDSSCCSLSSISIAIEGKHSHTYSCFTGFPTSFGIFQAYYSGLPEFASQTDLIPVIGTLAQGMCYLGAPFAAGVTKRFPQYQKQLIYAGWPLCILGLLTASFADSVPALIATQGFMYGLGFVVLTYPILNMLSEWWVARRGMAFGLISAASGLTGIVMPLILEALLRRYGHRITLRACAVAMVFLTGPLMPLLKGRSPTSRAADVAVSTSSSIPERSRQRPRTDWSFLRKPLFWTYGTATAIQGVGFFIPPVFVPSYAESIGLSATRGALLLAVMATAQTVGQFVLGWLSDGTLLPTSFLTSGCCVVAALATTTLWGLGKSLPTLIMYSIFYGFFAFGFGTLRVAMGRAVSSEQSTVLATYSAFVFLQGIGNVMVGPIAAGLISGTINLAEYGASRYKETVIFVAASSMLGGLIIIAHSAVKRCVAILR